MTSPKKREQRREEKTARDRPDPSSTSEKLDEALDESFPASDPIAVTPRRQDKGDKSEGSRQ